WRGRKATRTPASSPTPLGADGGPYGVSTSTSRDAYKSEHNPEPPTTPTSSGRPFGTVRPAPPPPPTRGRAPRQPSPALPPPHSPRHEPSPRAPAAAGAPWRPRPRRRAGGSRSPDAGRGADPWAPSLPARARAP